MKNDRLILSLVKAGILTADLETGQVYVNGQPRGWEHSTGYIRFEYYHRGKRRIITCQRVVWIFDEKKLPKYGWECDHDDCDKTNNKRTNLEMVPPAVNCRRAHRNGCCDNNPRNSNRCSTTGKYSAN